MSDSLRPHRRQPTRLPRPWDSPGKNTGVGCHFLLQCMKVKGESEVAQSCPTLSNPMDCSTPVFPVHQQLLELAQTHIHRVSELVVKIADFKEHLNTIFWGSKITADGDCSHEIKRRLLLERKVMTNLDSIFKSRDITLPTKVCLVKAMVFPVVLYGCESWTVKKAEC